MTDTTSDFYHPMRDATVHVYQRVDASPGGSAFIGRLHPYNVYPIFSTGDTSEEVTSKLEDLRTEAVEKFEASYIKRRKAMEAARKSRKTKSNT